MQKMTKRDLVQLMFVTEIPEEVKEVKYRLAAWLAYDDNVDTVYDSFFNLKRLSEEAEKAAEASRCAQRKVEEALAMIEVSIANAKRAEIDVQDLGNDHLREVLASSAVG